MNTLRLPILAAVALALGAPWACIAASPADAAQNCALALASQLHARLEGMHYQPNLDTSIATSGAPQNQIILSAQARNGVHGATMVCTYDRHGGVVSLQRPAPIDTMPLIDAASQN